MNDFLEVLAQAAIVYLILGSGLVIALTTLLRFARFNAATRHNLWLLTLLLVVLMPLVMLLPQPQQSSGMLGEAFVGVQGEPVVAADPENRPSDGTTVQTSELALPIETRSATSSLAPARVTLGIFILLIAGAVLKAFLFARAWLRLRQLFHRARPVNAAIDHQIGRLAAQLRIKHPPFVRHREGISSPLAGGVLQSWILLPTGFYRAQHSRAAMQQVLLHELAHIKRRDPLVALLQSVVSVFLFWHPAVYFINRQLLLEREMASDDWVLSLQPENPGAYATNLVQLAETMQQEYPSNLAVACVRGRNQLTQRIHMLLNRTVDHGTRLRRAPNVSISMVAAGLLALSTPLWPQFPHAQPGAEPHDAELQSETQTSQERTESNLAKHTIRAYESRQSNNGASSYTGEVAFEAENFTLYADQLDFADDSKSQWTASGGFVFVKIDNGDNGGLLLLGRQIEGEGDLNTLTVPSTGFSISDETLLRCGELVLDTDRSEMKCSGTGVTWRFDSRSLASAEQVDQLLESGQPSDDIEKAARLVVAVRTDNLRVAELLLESHIDSVKPLVDTLMNELKQKDSPEMLNLLAEARAIYR